MTTQLSPRIGVLLAGCGYLDGSEIHEAVLTLLAISKKGAQAICLAPDMVQHHVVNHLTGLEVIGESRNVLVEAARIARGAIHNLSDIASLHLDAFIVPGGYGAAKNLSSFAFDGTPCTIHPDVATAIQLFYKAGKPMGFICISPVLAAKVLGSEKIEVTIGNDASTAASIEAMGARHINCVVTKAHISKPHNIVSTPAYMLEASLADIATGIEQLVNNVVELVKK